jgi:hypothetical protein
VHVVRAAGRLGQAGAEVDVIDGVHVEGSLMSQQRGQAAGLLERLGLAVGGDVDDAAAPAMRLRPPSRSMSTSSPVTDRTTSGPVTKIRPAGPRMTMSVSAGP